MAEDDPWASWNPTANPVVKGNEAYQHRRALSRGLSADPGSPPALGAGRSTGTGRFQPIQASNGPSASGARKPLPEQSFPGASRGGPPNRGGPGGAAGGGGWQRSPPRGHIDRGWASKTGHFDPITKPEIVGDIASASNAPLTAVMTEEARAGRLERENKDKPKDNNRTRDRIADVRSRDADRDNKRSAPSQNERERERRRSRSREREYNKDRSSSDRKRPRTDDDDSDRRRTRPRSRSRSRSRDRDRDRRSERRDDRRDDRRNDRRDDGRDRRREDRDRDRPRDDKDTRRDRALAVKSSDRIDEKRKSPLESPPNRSPRPVKSSQDTRPAIVKPVVTQEDTPNSSGSSEGPAIVISGLLKGTTPTDVKTILKQYGDVEYCKESKSTGLPADKISFEAGFSSLKGAENAVKSLDGVVADGSTIQVKLVKSKAEDTEVAEPVKSPELKLKGFANSNSKDTSTSLLSRLGAPVPPAKTNGLARAAKTNGSPSNLPVSLLRPYDDLLRRAGVTSLDKLRGLVRPNSIKAYVEMLCKEYPNEDVLQGVTARWALKDRLEEWLGEKEPLQMDWTNNKASGENVKREEVEDGGIDLV